MIHKSWNIIASKSLEPYLEIGLGHTVQCVFLDLKLLLVAHCHTALQESAAIDWLLVNLMNYK